MTVLEKWKLKKLEAVASEQERLKKTHPLRHLFLELTLQCNEHCLHCGSNCSSRPCPTVSAADYHALLAKVKRDFEGRLPFLALTGGEPLLRKDFLDIANDAHDMGFVWGITSNATLINKAMAREMSRAGMYSISVSVDGPEAVHDRIRERPGAYREAMRGIEALIGECGSANLQITSVINHGSIGELDRMFECFVGLDIDSWRIVDMEPIGRAKLNPDLLLTPDERLRLLDFIREKREMRYPVTYGCCHYLGLKYEREVRDWFFCCQAGRTVASVMTNGDIGACLNIPRNSRTVQGNIYRDDFSRVWEEKFEFFRGDWADESAECSACPHKRFCGGGSCHSWDFDGGVQQVCMRGTAFE